MAVLKKGDKFPNFTVETESQKGLTTDEMVKHAKKTVFWVLRYIGFTTCRWDVHQIMLNYTKFVDRDTQVYVVMQSDPAKVRRDLEGYDMPYHIICDYNQEIYNSLDIKRTATKEERQPTDEADKAKLAAKMEKVKASGFVHGDYEGNEQQLPAMFITDDRGNVLYAHYAKNSIDMPTVDETLAIIDSLR